MLLPIPAESLVPRPETDTTTPVATEAIVAHDVVVVDVRVHLKLGFYRLLKLNLQGVQPATSCRRAAT